MGARLLMPFSIHGNLYHATGVLYDPYDRRRGHLKHSRLYCNFIGSLKHFGSICLFKPALSFSLRCEPSPWDLHPISKFFIDHEFCLTVYIGVYIVCI